MAKSSESAEAISPAPLEIRNFVYSSLIRLSPASDFQVLTHGSKGLLERGLENTPDYGGLPGSLAERKDLAAKVRLLLNQNFPDFLRRNPHGIRHVHECWIDDNGETNLWHNKDFAFPFLDLAFDSDYQENSVVLRQIAKLLFFRNISNDSQLFCKNTTFLELPIQRN